jgi:branched-subunit amino acid aminotransferase/4-amino-4-deoxychorismate lyase
MRYTPPVACGLLPGTFRAELLDTARIRERVMTRDDIRSASRVWLINSLREWIDITVTV